MIPTAHEHRQPYRQQDQHHQQQHLQQHQQQQLAEVGPPQTPVATDIDGGNRQRRFHGSPNADRPPLSTGHARGASLRSGLLQIDLNRGSSTGERKM